MVKLYDISGWSEQPWWNTGGTRNKKIYLNPDDGERYFFKESFNKGKRDFKYEFWSEIVASEVGAILDFTVLPYHIAMDGKTVGCLSKSMIKMESQELVEGGKYLQAFDSTFEPEDIKKRNRYDFQLILNSMFSLGQEKFIGQLIDVILFDAVIGNSDRHQENWAIINTHSTASKSLSIMEKVVEMGIEDEIPRFARWFIKNLYLLKGKRQIRPEIAQARLMLAKDTEFAPIYDSGCSFGRELEEERVLKMLQDETSILKYIEKGLAEIHWDGVKVNHFALLENIINEVDFKTMLLQSMERVLRNFDKEKLVNAVKQVDAPLKALGHPDGLPDHRKDLMIKLLLLRKDRIQDLYDRYRRR